MKNILISCVTVLFIFVVYFFAVRHFYFDLVSRGQFGDMFGGMNALFSGLAFLGVIYAIILQKEELKLQRNELELTRKELKRTAEAQEKSQLALSRQAESLKANAKLNGLSATLAYYGSLIEAKASSKYDGGIDAQAKVRAEEIIEKIERIIEDK